MKLKIHILILVSCFQLSFAQGWYEIKCKLYENDTSNVVYGAVIINKTSHFGTLSNSIGNFKMRVKKGDTLEISHISHHSIIVSFENPESIKSDIIKLIMFSKTYELPSIDIANYRIRQKPLPLQTMRRSDNITIDMGDLKLGVGENYQQFNNMNRNMSNMMMPVVGIPIGDWNMNKRIKQYEKIAQLEAKHIYQQNVEIKYNKSIVNKLTGLKGNELEQFMNYCKPSDKVIFGGNDYDMTYAILQCYDKFRIEFDD